jgi:hypothetical protein
MLTRFHRTVPRGAQTWEVPLHTPDILAAAHLVKACVLGYQLGGDSALLEEAEYWAWSGVPFIYLVNPTSGHVGPYSTIAVLGATNWESPVWFGQPVQWCGLVYADALRRLGRFRPDGPWERLANGIALAGVQHTWPATDTDRHGLLPDFFLLRAQRREGPAINPATVQSQAIEAYGHPPVYDLASATTGSVLIHAAGRVQELVETDAELTFKVQGWHQPSSWVLVIGCAGRPVVSVNGKVLEEEVEYAPTTAQLSFPVPPRAEVRLSLSEGAQRHSP